MPKIDPVAIEAGALCSDGTCVPAGGPRHRFGTVQELLRNKTTDLPVVCYYPSRLRAAAAHFVERFPGEVLYAVKANPDPEVLCWLIEGGIGSFDTASIAEIRRVRTLVPDARCSFNHPVKARSAIVEAHRSHGIRDFVVDHNSELEKIIEEVGIDVIVQIRIACQNSTAKVNFNEKFGATPRAAVELLQSAQRRGVDTALGMHVGWQTRAPQAFANGLDTLMQVARQSGVRPRYFNIGGGFPSILMPEGLRLQDFFDAISAAHSAAKDFVDTPLRCEPGSALAHPGASVLAHVLLVKEGAVYLNDGLYGALAEIIQSRTQPLTIVLTPTGEVRAGSPTPYRVFGPTCDSYDTMPVPFNLPTDVREGDWLHFAMMGAYSTALITDFNGLGAHEFVIIE